jgi:glycosyltransferase involved in cell wall biosynthesis
MKDIAENAACLVDPYRTDSIREGLEKVIRDPAYRERLVLLGLEIVKKYEPEAIALRYYQLYQEISNETCAE